MNQKEELIQTIEKYVFMRLAKALTDYYENHQEHVYFDLERTDLGLDNTFFWKYGFTIREAIANEDHLRFSGIITSELAKPFREHLQSYEIDFEGSANWWSGETCKAQELRDLDIESMIVPVLQKLDDSVLVSIKTALDSIMVEKLTLGESDPFANTFDDMFTKEK